MMKSLFSVVIAFSIILPAFAQEEEDDGNLVMNGSFEELTDDLRRDESFGLVKSWANGGNLEADVFSAAIEDDDVAAPKNYRGTQEPKDGNNYAGFYAYYFNQEEPRTYLYTELKDKLEKEQLYCVKMSLSLAELSRYAVNNIGVVLSKGDESDDDAEIILLDNYYTADRNPIIKEQAGWFEFCTTIQAEGGEDNLLIGNFESDRKLRTEKMPSPTEKYEEPQGPMAYYFIDDVSVKRVSRGSECRCSNESGIPQNDLVYSSTTSITEEMTMTQKMEASTIYFQQYSADLRPAAKRGIDQVIEFLEDNPLLNVKVIGHSDKEEVKLAMRKPQLKGLAQTRADKVVQYMTSNGIGRGRIRTEAKDDKEPASPMESAISLSKNRRVEFRPITK